MLKVPPSLPTAHTPYELVHYDYRDQVVEASPLDGAARIVFVDPPYNIGVDYNGDPTGDRMPEDEYRAMLARALRSQARWLAPGGTCWWVVPHTHLEWLGPMMEAIIGPRHELIVWHEAFSQYQRTRLTRDWRFVIAHTNDPGRVVMDMDAIRVTSKRQELGDKRADPRGRIPGTMWPIRRLQGTALDRVNWHNAQLPPELLERIVKGWSATGDVVIDGFAGSGSMGCAALRHGRRFVGIERSREYRRRMAERLDAVVESGLEGAKGGAA